MEFEYDPAKSETNKEKHGIDFEQAQELWNDEMAIEGATPYQKERRLYRIGQIRGRLWTAIFTHRGSRIRLISVRRAWEKEAARYRGGI